jgi:hypothetical protein
VFKIVVTIFSSKGQFIDPGDQVRRSLACTQQQHGKADLVTPRVPLPTPITICAPITCTEGKQHDVRWLRSGIAALQQPPYDGE